MTDSLDPAAPGPPLRLPADRAPDVIDVLRTSFADYPVMRYILEDRERGYGERLRTLIHFFVMARVLRDEPILGIGKGDRLAAAATISDSETPGSPPELDELRESAWEELGPDARARYETVGSALSEFAVEVPHLHLNMIGVRPSQQGTGLARGLLEGVRRISGEHPLSEGVTLDTDPTLVGFYEPFGYEALGHERISPEVEVWRLYRPDGPR